MDFIPNFKYDIINLKEITYEELQTCEDLLSALMIIDKIKKPSDFEKIKSIKEEYWEKLKANVNTRRELEKIAEAMSLLLQRINVPQEEIDEVIENVYDGRLDKMFEMSVHYDWQETRKLALEEGIELGIEKGIEKGKLEIILNMLRNKLDEETVAKLSGLNLEEIKEIKRQLKM
jgi:predicted transposase/invertase (TIGR01784 family)